jgi:hypothetical protein
MMLTTERLLDDRWAGKLYKLKMSMDELLEYYDEREGRLTTADGTYTLAVGTSSRDLSEQASFTLGRRHP